MRPPDLGKHFALELPVARANKEIRELLELGSYNNDPKTWAISPFNCRPSSHNVLSYSCFCSAYAHVLSTTPPVSLSLNSSLCYAMVCCVLFCSVLLCSVLFCSVLFCSVLFCSVLVWYGMVWYGMVWYGMVWYGMVWYGMVWYGMVWHGMVWYGMVWYGMVCYGRLV